MMYADLFCVSCCKKKKVNKNLIGTGYMSTDQKKKLLWGNKKNTTAEEVFIRLFSHVILLFLLFHLVLILKRIGGGIKGDITNPNGRGKL